MEAAARSVAREGRPRGEGRRGGPRAPGLTELAEAVRAELGEEWPPRVYRERVRTLRTRAHRLPAAGRGVRVEVQHTLLGVELKAGRRRVSCPDLSTARYLAFFARAGCAEVAVPYDITKISHLADRLERGFERALLTADSAAAGRADTFRARLRRFIVAEVRREIVEAGAGEAVPQFNQTTRQRPHRA